MADLVLDIEVGRKYFFQTCTKDWIGYVLAVRGPYTVVIGPDPEQPEGRVAWVSESGRLHAFLEEGNAEGMEIECCPKGNTVGLQWVNWHPWNHPLFEETV